MPGDRTLVIVLRHACPKLAPGLRGLEGFVHRGQLNGPLLWNEHQIVVDLPVDDLTSRWGRWRRHYDLLFCVSTLTMSSWAALQGSGPMKKFMTSSAGASR